MKTLNKISLKEYASPFTMNFRQNVLDLVRKEDLYFWANKEVGSPIPIQEKIRYYEKIGKDYLKSK